MNKNYIYRILGCFNNCQINIAAKKDDRYYWMIVKNNNNDLDIFIKLFHKNNDSNYIKL